MLRNMVFAEHCDATVIVVFPKCFTLLKINVEFDLSKFFSECQNVFDMYQ